jgi:hypothetical protein
MLNVTLRQRLCFTNSAYEWGSLTLTASFNEILSQTVESVAADLNPLIPADSGEWRGHVTLMLCNCPFYATLQLQDLSFICWPPESVCATELDFFMCFLHQNVKKKTYLFLTVLLQLLWFVHGRVTVWPRTICIKCGREAVVSYLRYWRKIQGDGLGESTKHKIAGVRTWNPPDTSDSSFQSDPELAETATNQ